MENVSVQAMNYQQTLWKTWKSCILLLKMMSKH